MLAPERLEIYLRRAAALGSETLLIPPFVCLFNPSNPLRFFNYAKPLEPVSAGTKGLAESLAALRAAFRERERLPRFEFIEAFAPDLGPALIEAGFTLEACYPLLVCTPETLRRRPAIPGLTITTLTPNSPAEDLRACLTVQEQGFAEMAGDPPSEDDLDVLRHNLVEEGAFLARMAGAPAAAMMYTAPLDGLTELAGGTTLEAYRRRGIGAAITVAATADAFRRGVEIALLTAASEDGSRVFQRAGYRPCGTVLAYCEAG